jgi:hypothetical protein
MVFQVLPDLRQRSIRCCLVSVSQNKTSIGKQIRANTQIKVQVKVMFLESCLIDQGSAC